MTNSTNLVERVEGCQLNDIKSMVAMELYLGSVIEPIRKSICNMLYFNSKHAPKTLGEAMQKAQDLHIKHLYAKGEDQQDSTTTGPDVTPETFMTTEAGIETGTKIANLRKTRVKQSDRQTITRRK